MHLKYAIEYRKERNLPISCSGSTITLILRVDNDRAPQKSTENLTYEY